MTCLRCLLYNINRTQYIDDDGGATMTIEKKPLAKRIEEAQKAKAKAEAEAKKASKKKGY